MNRYPVWKYVILGLSLVFGLLYTLPNFFGEAPAVQVSSAKATQKIDDSMVRARVVEHPREAGIESPGLFFDGNSDKARIRPPRPAVARQGCCRQAQTPDPKTRRGSSR